MKLPRIIRKEYRTPVVLSMILTFAVWNAFGFGWFGLPSLGFVTAGGAEQLATAKMEKVAVPLAAQLCAMKFNTQDSATIEIGRAHVQFHLVCRLLLEKKNKLHEIYTIIYIST